MDTKEINNITDWTTESVGIGSDVGVTDMSDMSISLTPDVISGITPISGNWVNAVAAQGSVTVGSITYPAWTTTTTGTGVTGTGGYNWNSGSNRAVISAEGQMELYGKNADIKINGQSLSDWMTRVEQRLNILVPNPELEKEWDELRQLGERYRQLEQKCQEKSEVWQKLKSMPATKD